jgi:hypothetical protein
MFANSYETRYCGKKTKKEGEFVFIEHKLTFDCRFNHQYIINVEEYNYEVFIIKFHLKNHSDSDRKYNLLTNFNDPQRLIRTCIEVMLEFYRRHPYS